MFRASSVPWALQLTCGQSIMISLSQLPPAQSHSAVPVTLYARVHSKAGGHCASLPYFALKPKEWPWYGLWSIFGLNVLQRLGASCRSVSVFFHHSMACAQIMRLCPTLHWSLGMHGLFEYLWFERLAESGSILFHQGMACVCIVRLCSTLYWTSIRWKPKIEPAFERLKSIWEHLLYLDRTGED